MLPSLMQQLSSQQIIQTGMICKHSHKILMFRYVDDEGEITDEEEEKPHVSSSTNINSLMYLSSKCFTLPAELLVATMKTMTTITTIAALVYQNCHQSRCHLLC